jgi:hypothetical protein
LLDKLTVRYGSWLAGLAPAAYLFARPIGRGAQLEARDTLWNSTPLGWAQHGKHTRAEEYLLSLPRAAA